MTYNLILARSNIIEDISFSFSDPTVQCSLAYIILIHLYARYWYALMQVLYYLDTYYRHYIILINLTAIIPSSFYFFKDFFGGDFLPLLDSDSEETDRKRSEREGYDMQQRLPAGTGDGCGHVAMQHVACAVAMRLSRHSIIPSSRYALLQVLHCLDTP